MTPDSTDTSKTLLMNRKT